jgi:predicted transcriptional regulator
MAKKVAVVVRDRQHEALRMAVGLTLDDAAVSVYVMDNKLASDENIDLNVETIGDMDGKIYSNNPENKFDQMTTEEIALALADADAVVAY